MHTVIMQTRVRIGIGDRVRYNPPFAHPYSGQTAVIKGFAADERNPDSRYWVEVEFDHEKKSESEKVQFLALRYTILEESRETMP